MGSPLHCAVEAFRTAPRETIDIDPPTWFLGWSVIEQLACVTVTSVTREARCVTRKIM